MAQINLDAIRSFAVFADSLNFCAAAAQLHISQPALHVKIRKLTQQLGLPLYRRVGRQLELTVHGHTVARHGRQLISCMDACVRELHGQGPGEPVIMAAGGAAFQYLLGTAIEQFLGAAASPLKLLTLNRDDAIEAVRLGKAHLAVAPLESIPADLTATLLTEVGQVLAVPAAHHLAQYRRLALQDLAGSSMVVPPSGAPHRDALARALRAAGVDWQVAVEAGGWELMLQFVRLGIGIAVVNAYCRLPDGVVAIPLPDLPALSFYVIHLRGQQQGSELALLQRLLVTNADTWKVASTWINEL